MTTANRPVNPYAKPRSIRPQNEANVGRQSQQRIGNQHKRKFKHSDNSSSKKRKGGQATLLGGVAFESDRDCIVCHARALRKFTPSCRVPNRSHHAHCARNTKTHGKGELTGSQLATLEDNQRCKQLTRPIAEAEKASAKHLPRDGDAAFFAPRKMASKTMTKATTPTQLNNRD